MFNDWYPKKINVNSDGTPATYEFLTSVFEPEAHFSYAEFGFYKADTAKNVCELFPNATLYLFDYENNISPAKERLKKYPNRIFYFGNSQRFNDSYNWNLTRLFFNNNAKPIFDYCFLDGAHTFAIDALNFFICDRMLRTGGYLDFDDYDWTLANSPSLNPQSCPAIKQQYTDEQIEIPQVRMIVDGFVKTDTNYTEVIKNKIYRKLSI